MRFRFIVDGAHMVEVGLGLLSARETVWVDGEVVHDARSMRLSNELPVVVGGKTATLQIATGWNLLPRVSLLLDGCSIDRLPGHAEVPRRLRADARSPIPQMPRWAWPFVAACALIPFVTIGGAIPAVLGIGGAISCSTLASKTDWNTGRRVASCVGVTIVCWMALGALFSVT